MATNFPSNLDNFTNPTSSDTLDSPDHATQHADVNDAVEALQEKVGVDSSAVTTSLDYRVSQLEGAPSGPIRPLTYWYYNTQTIYVANLPSGWQAIKFTVTSGGGSGGGAWGGFSNNTTYRFAGAGGTAGGTLISRWIPKSDIDAQGITSFLITVGSGGLGASAYYQAQGNQGGTSRVDASPSGSMFVSGGGTGGIGTAFDVAAPNTTSYSWSLTSLFSEPSANSYGYFYLEGGHGGAGRSGVSTDLVPGGHGGASYWGGGAAGKEGYAPSAVGDGYSASFYQIGVGGGGAIAVGGSGAISGYKGGNGGKGTVFVEII